MYEIFYVGRPINVPFPVARFSQYTSPKIIPSLLEKITTIVTKVLQTSPRFDIVLTFKNITIAEDPIVQTCTKLIQIIMLTIINPITITQIITPAMVITAEDRIIDHTHVSATKEF